MMSAALDARGVVLTCPSCGRANRLRYESLGRSSRCGQCKTALAGASTPIEVTSSEAFDAACAHSALPVVVDFWAPWCGPCRMVAPEIERVARAAAGRYLVLKVNTDALQDVAGHYRIQSIPTMSVIFRGQELDRAAGARPAADIEAFVERTLDAHHVLRSERRSA